MKLELSDELAWELIQALHGKLAHAKDDLMREQIDKAPVNDPDWQQFHEQRLTVDKARVAQWTRLTEELLNQPPVAALIRSMLNG